MGYQKKEKLKNKNKIFKYISTNKIFNKQDISENLNLSFPTVTKYIEEFLEQNIIQDIGIKNSKYNRPSITYQFNPNSLYSIGIKLEVNRVSFIIINLSGDILRKNEIHNNFYNHENFSKYIVQQLKVFLQDFSNDYNKFIGIGISLPGIVDNEAKKFEIGTNFKLFSQDMKFIEEEMELPIFLMNEANAAVLGESLLNNFKYKNLAFISIDTGIGAGIVLNNKLYEGENFKAGEIGHFSIIPNGRECSCGNKGCFERYCSNVSLINDFNENFDMDINSLNDIFFNNLHLTTTGKDLLQFYIENLARAIQTLLLIFDLNKIIIGGEICYYKDFFNLENNLKDLIFNNVFCKDSNILEFSKYGDSSNLIGVALTTFKTLM